MLLTTEPSTQVTLSGSTNGDLHAKPRGQTRHRAGSPNPEEHRGTKSQAGDQSPQSNAEGPRNGDGSSGIHQQTNVASSEGLGPSPACRPLHHATNSEKDFVTQPQVVPQQPVLSFRGWPANPPTPPQVTPWHLPVPHSLSRGTPVPGAGTQLQLPPAAASSCAALCHALFSFSCLAFL